jgi:hypothetical protein
VSAHLLADDVPGAVPLANRALALARQIGAPALIAADLLAVGATVAGTDLVQARACLRESRELSTDLGYQSAIDLIWGTALAALLPVTAFGHRRPRSLGTTGIYRRHHGNMRRDGALAVLGRGPRLFQDHYVRPRMVNGRSMDRLAHRVASVMSVHPARRKAPMARLRMAAMILGPDRVLTWELSSR